MDLKEFKKVVVFAKKHGVRALTIEGFAVEFFQGVLPTPQRKLKAAPAEPETGNMKVPDMPPTLDQINQYIYSQNEEVG